MTGQDLNVVRGLLLSGCPKNKLKALTQIEQATDLQLADVLADEIMVELVCLNSPEASEVLVMAGRLAMTCPAAWSRFRNAMIDPRFLTCQKIDIMILTNVLNRERVYTKSFTLQKLGLSNYAYSSSAAIAKLVENADNELMDLSGLKFLSPKSAEALQGFEANIRLDGITEVSSETAGFLAKHSRGELSLTGLESATDEVLLQLSDHSKLKIDSVLRKRMKKLKTDSKEKKEGERRTGVCNLSKSQGNSIRKLLRSKDSANVTVAVGMVQDLEATEDDLIDIFTPTLLSLLVNTWDVQIWNALSPVFAINERIRNEVCQLTCKRILKEHPAQVKFMKSLETGITELAYPFIIESGIFDAPLKTSSGYLEAARKALDARFSG